MQESVSMHKSPTLFHAFAHESTKVEGKSKREIVKTEARRLMERKAAQQNKNLSEELKQCLPAQPNLTEREEKRLMSPPGHINMTINF